jgi:hypothetical protein
LGEESDEGGLADEDGFSASVGTGDYAELADVCTEAGGMSTEEGRGEEKGRTALEVDIVCDEVDAFLHFETRVTGFLKTDATSTTFEDGRLDVGDRGGEGGGGETAGRGG